MNIDQKEKIIAFIDKNQGKFKNLNACDCIERNIPPEIIEVAFMMGMNPFQKCNAQALLKGVLTIDCATLKFLVSSGMEVTTDDASEVLYELVCMEKCNIEPVRYLLNELGADVHWENDKIIKQARMTASNNILRMILNAKTY